MDNLRNNTLSINVIILIIAILSVFILYVIKDYNSNNQGSIDLSNQIFKKYKGYKDENIYKSENNSIIEEKKPNEIMKDNFFIKKKNKNIDDLYIKKLNNKNKNIISELKKKIKLDDNTNIVNCDKKKHIVKDIEEINIDEQILNTLNKKSEFVLKSSYFEKNDLEDNNIQNTLSKNSDFNVDNKLSDLEGKISKLRELSIN